MNQHPNDHDPVSESFASFRNGASNMFPAPEVDDVMAAAPARRRRRAIGVTVAITTATGLTAAGMAVAQNINDAPPPVADNTSEELSSSTPSPPTTEEDEWTEDDTFEPEPSEEDESPDEAPAFHFQELPNAGDECPGGEYEFRNHEAAPTEWELEQPDAPWELDGASLTGDVNDDGSEDLVLSLTCEGHAAVAAFDQVETENGLELHQLGWVWLPDDGPETAGTFELAELDDGVITLRFSDETEESYAFNGEAFTLIDEDDPDDNETPTEEPTEEPDESPTEDDDMTE